MVIHSTKHKKVVVRMIVIRFAYALTELFLREMIILLWCIWADKTTDFKVKPPATRQKDCTTTLLVLFVTSGDCCCRPKSAPFGKNEHNETY